MERNWTSVGKRLTEGNEDKFKKIFDNIKWKDIPCSMAMCPAMAIDAIIEKCNIPKIRRVGTSNELAPNGLVAIEARYKNGMARIYAIDEGHRTTVLCSYFYPNEEQEAA